MTRSSFKGPFIQGHLSKKLLKKVPAQAENLWARSSTILPENVGHRWKIHNGRNFVILQVTESMIGHKFGEFALTRRKGVSKKKKVRKR